MKKLCVNDILERVNGTVLCGLADVEFAGACIDSRTLQPDEAYFALKGERTDGTLYCGNAIKSGAKVCFVENNIFSDEDLNKFAQSATIVLVPSVEDALVEIAKVKRSLYDIPVVAITGSVGKTSTKDVIAEVMAQKFNVQKTQENKNNRLGVPLTIMSLRNHDALVIEMGMNHLGEIHELTNIAKPSLSVISNIGTSHIGNLGSRENILKAKLEILDGMTNKKVIINNDNDMLHKWNLEDETAEKITFGVHEKSKYVASKIKMTEKSNEFCVELNSNEYEFTTQKPGEVFILNALSAIAVGMEYDIPIDKMQKAIANAEITKNRLDIEKVNDILLIKDYYNASFESIKPSLEYLANLDRGRKIAVLGDIKEVGSFSKEIHEKVGKEVAKNKIDMLVTVGEEAKNIAKMAVEEGMNAKNVYSCDLNEQAIKILNNMLVQGDTVLLKASNSMKFGEIYDGISNYISK